ncbi:MAG: prepilin peptidase [Alphaproteobacteria bacterium]
MHLLAIAHAWCPVVSAWLLAVAMLLVIWLDGTRYIIPNSLNLALLALYAFDAFFLHLPFLHALVAAAPLLLVGLGLFALGLMGGGDVKLLAVLALWTGLTHVTGEFLLLTALLGGVLVIVVMTLRFFARTIYQPREGRVLPRLLTRKQPVPYGLAVAGAFLFLLVAGDVPALPRLF